MRDPSTPEEIMDFYDEEKLSLLYQGERRHYVTALEKIAEVCDLYYIATAGPFRSDVAAHCFGDAARNIRAAIGADGYPREFKLVETSTAKAQIKKFSKAVKSDNREQNYSGFDNFCYKHGFTKQKGRLAFGKQLGKKIPVKVRIDGTPRKFDGWQALYLFDKYGPHAEDPRMENLIQEYIEPPQVEA